jgi:hypothetical protein
MRSRRARDSRRRRHYRDDVMLAVRTMGFVIPFTSIVTVTDFGFALSAPWDWMLTRPPSVQAPTTIARLTLTSPHIRRRGRPCTRASPARREDRRRHTAHSRRSAPPRSRVRRPDSSPGSPTDPRRDPPSGSAGRPPRRGPQQPHIDTRTSCTSPAVTPASDSIRLGSLP